MVNDGKGMNTNTNQGMNTKSLHQSHLCNHPSVVVIGYVPLEMLKRNCCCVVAWLFVLILAAILLTFG